MQKMIKGIVFATIMGVVVPAIFMHAMQSADEDNPVIQEQTTTIKETERTVASDHFLIPILLQDGKVEMMALEDYIVGVVLAEMPADFEIEALKAQAVVARTYALKRNLISQKHMEQAVCTNPSCCQAYCTQEEYIASGGTNTALEKVEDAVIQTKNEVLTYNSELIDATYFSCSGGKTEDAKAVWGADVPYLQSVDSPGEEYANHHIDTVYFTLDEFADCLQIKTELLTGNWIGEISYTKGGGVAKVSICNQLYSGVELRKLLGLRSTAFIISAVGNKVTVTTKGFGHRVGMSQYGADAMAVSGKNYKEILSHYYKGAVVDEIAI